MVEKVVRETAPRFKKFLEKLGQIFEDVESMEPGRSEHMSTGSEMGSEPNIEAVSSPDSGSERLLGSPEAYTAQSSPAENSADSLPDMEGLAKAF